MTEHHSTRRARALDTDKKRQKKRRVGKKAKGAPLTHTVNRAIAEGLLDSLAVELENGVPLHAVGVSAESVFVRALESLTKGTSAISRYQSDEVTKAFRDRITRARGRHKDSLLS